MSMARSARLANSPITHINPWKSGNATFSETTDRAGARTDSPDLGPAFEFLEKTTGDCPGLSRIHCFCYPATLSHGAISGDIPAISAGARRFAQGIAARLYRDDVAQHYAAIEAYSEPKLQGDEWMPADPPPIRFSAMKAGGTLTGGCAIPGDRPGCR